MQQSAKEIQQNQNNTQMETEDKIDEQSQGFQYSNCNFECRIYKKRMINSQLQYCYISDDYIAISEEPYKKNPDRVIQLNNEVKVEWIYDRKQMNIKMIGFIFKRVGEEIEYMADEEVLKRLKEVFRKRIFQSRFQDEYEVLRQIGKGNYARVYAVRHKVTGQKYAVKCFEKRKLEGVEKGILSLYNELKIMRTLDDHPNVIKLYETFEGENTYYLVMEIVEGSSLYDEMKRHIYKDFTEQEIFNIMLMLVRAAVYMAQNNIMHRDLKLENILFASKGIQSELKIVDFGLATFCDEAPYIFPKCGTPGFVAPEIANLVDKQNPYDKICDMFSIGVIFHILLTGEAVFKGKKFNEVLQKNKECDIKYEGNAYEFMHQDTLDLLKQMLQKDCKNRITAEEALKHPYFSQKFRGGFSTQQSNNNGSVNTIGSSSTKVTLGGGGSAHELEANKIDKIPDIRPKKKSEFTKPVRIPYIKKDDAVDPKHEDLSSLVTAEPIWAGEKQNEIRLQQQQKQYQIPQIPDSGYYTVGSFDTHIKQFQGQSPLQQQFQSQQNSQSPYQQNSILLSKSPLQAKHNPQMENISQFMPQQQMPLQQQQQNNIGNGMTIEQQQQQQQQQQQILTQQAIRKSSSNYDRVKKNSCQEPIEEDMELEEDDKK